MQTQSIYRRILILALPTVAYNLIEMALGLTDLYMVRGFGSAATAALGVNRQICFLLEAIILAGAAGTVTVISQNLARNATDIVEKTVVQSLTLITLLATALGIMGYLASPALLTLSNASPETTHFALGYLKIYCASLPFLAFNAVGAAALRAAKNPMLPLKIVLCMAIANVPLNYGFIHGVVAFPDLGVQGAAVGTLIVRILGVLAFLVVLTRPRQPVRLVPSRLLPFDLSGTRNVLRIGMPIAMAGILRNAARVVIVAIAGLSTLGVSLHAAVGLGLQIRLISILPALAFQVALATLVGDAIGRGKLDEAADIGRRGVLLLAGLMLTVCGTTILLAEPIARAFIVNPDDLAIATRVLRWFSVGQFFSTLAIGAQGALLGAGDTKPVARITFATQWLILVPLAYALLVPLHLDPDGILIAWVISPVFTFLLLYQRFIRAHWKSETATTHSSPAK
jgi:putative MATE family efflux protein